METAILWLGLILLTVGLGVYTWYQLRWKRPLQLKKLSSHLRLSPEPDASVLMESGLLDAPLFKRHRTKSQNVLRGEVRGAEVFVFDYAFGDGPRWRVPDSVVFFRLRQARLPAFELRPRGPKDPRGLELESHPRFCEIYALTGSDEKAVSEVFRGDVLDFFERGENQSWAVTSTGEWVAATFWPLGERERVLDPKEVMGFVEDAKEVLFVLTA